MVELGFWLSVSIGCILFVIGLLVFFYNATTANGWGILLGAIVLLIGYVLALAVGCVLGNQAFGESESIRLDDFTYSYRAAATYVGVGEEDKRAYLVFDERLNLEEEDVDFRHRFRTVRMADIVNGTDGFPDIKLIKGNCYEIIPLLSFTDDLYPRKHLLKNTDQKYCGGEEDISFGGKTR